MKVICFDLDDTLYKEIDYLKSAYKDIAKAVFKDDWEQHYQQMILWFEAKEDVFQKVHELNPAWEKADLLNMYRFDVHELELDPEVNDVLSSLKASGVKLGLITDGRQITQMNKIKSLGLDNYFDGDMIIISESFGSLKPSFANYEYFMQKFPDCHDFTYVGDNPQKDFVAPNALGWKTVCLLDDGRNIHKQQFEELRKEYLPKVKIRTLKDILQDKE